LAKSILTLTGRGPLLPLAGRLRADRQLHTEGLAAARRVVDRGINDLVDSVHQAGHVLVPTQQTSGRTLPTQPDTHTQLLPVTPGSSHTTTRTCKHRPLSSPMSMKEAWTGLKLVTSLLTFYISELKSKGLSFSYASR
jgi:hypothetical protein